MSYTAGEALILTRIQAISGFTSANTSRANWGILNRGSAAYYVILRPGAFEIRWNTFRSYIATYNTVIEVWQRYTNDADSKTNLYARVADLLPALQFYPHLGDGTNSDVIDASLTSAPEPTEQWVTKGGPQWLRWDLTLTWQQEICITFSE